MTIDEIIHKRFQLENQLAQALSTMEKKTTIFDLRKELMQIQKECPHDSEKYNWVIKNHTCPYCGFIFG